MAGRLIRHAARRCFHTTTTTSRHSPAYRQSPRSRSLDAPRAALKPMAFLLSVQRVSMALGLWLGLTYAPAALPQASSASSNGTLPARSDMRVPEEFTGIVINQTLTPLGQEFFNRFIEFWREKPQYDTYSLVITERHSRRYGSQISILHRQRAVFGGNLPFKYGLIKAFSGDAVEKAYTNVISLNLRNATDRDPDIAEDEF